MSTKITDEIAEALKRHGHPLQLKDAAGETYFVMTSDQFQQYVYDDSDLSPDEMFAAAQSGIEDPEGWGAEGMDEYEQDDEEGDT